MTSQQRVLVCDDELVVLRALRMVLREAGFEVRPACRAPPRRSTSAAVDPPDAAIVDLLLPDGDGAEVCARLREWSDMPILVLSAVGDEQEKVRALAAGADDYVTKPFGPAELVARLNAVLRRARGPAGDPRIDLGELEIDLSAHLVRRAGQELHLTKTEFELLRVLAVNRGRLMTHRALLTEVWGLGYADDIQVLRTHIARLRAKIEPGAGAGARYIQTDPGVGYRLIA